MLREEIYSDQYVHVSHFIRGDFSWSAFINSDPEGARIDTEVLDSDNVLYHLMLHEYPIGVIYLPYVMGRYPYSKEKDVHDYHGSLIEKPGSDLYDDVRQRSANLYNLKELFGGWDFIGGDIPSIPGEHSVTHIKPIGQVITGYKATDVLRPDSTQGVKDFPYAAQFTTTSDGIRYELEHVATPNEGGVISDFIEGIKVSCNNGTLDQYFHPYELHYSSFSYSMDPSGSIEHISYHIEMVGYGEWEYHRKFEVRITPHPIPLQAQAPLPDGYYNLNAFVSRHWEFSIRWVESLAWEPLISSWAPFWYDHSRFEIPVTVSRTIETCDSYFRFAQSTETSKGFAGIWDVNILGQSNLLIAFQKAVERVGSDLAKACVQSTNDALETHFPKLEANFLESFSDLSDLRSLVNPQGLKRAHEFMTKKGTRSAKGFLDILSDVKLTYEFGIVPTVSDAEEIALRASALRDRYRVGNMYGLHTINGKFVYEIPNGAIIGFDGAVMISRSKLRVRFDEQSILGALMPIRAAGVLPSLSNLWDLVRYSFAVDWFLNIGDRLGIIDNQAIMFASGVAYSCHSTQVLWKFPADTLDDNGCVSPGASAGLSYYCRSLMRRNPVVMDGRFDFLQATGPSDWGTAGSFFYKMLIK